MKTKSYRFFALGAVVVNLIAAQMVTRKRSVFPQASPGRTRCLRSTVPAQRPSI